jgi:hypothetical protein
MITRAIKVIALLAIACFGTVATAADSPAEKWRIQLQGQASSDGEVRLRLTPQSGEPIVVTVKIHSGRGELYMAKDILAALKAQLPAKQYRSEIVHGADVLVKAGHGGPSFSLEVVDSNVPGTRLKLGPA